MGFSKWYAATGCSDGPGSGALALQAVILEFFPPAENWGVFNCRNVRGGSYYSPHAEGRAGDDGMPMSNGRGSKIGHELVDLLVKAGSRLGIQAVIYDRTIWSAKSPGGRRYDGSHPHYDHVHWEITRSAARKLTKKKVRRVFRDILGQSSGGGGGSSSSSIDWGDYRKVKIGNRTLSLGDRGSDVKELQRILNAWYPRTKNLADVGKVKTLAQDGDYGPKTEAVVKYLQTRAKIKVDGIAGPQTWRALRVR